MLQYYKSVSELGPQGTERSQAGEKESDGSDVDESFATGRQALIIASQTPEADQPAKGALNDPATLPPDAVFWFCVFAMVFSSRNLLV